jgi:hypothetical protein
MKLLPAGDVTGWAHPCVARLTALGNARGILFSHKQNGGALSGANVNITASLFFHSGRPLV